MNILNEYFVLNNGVKIPKIALGTWQIEDNVVEGVVKYALSIGYRHIDSAIQYYNEEGIGRALQSCGIPRRDIFITTKIPSTTKDYESTLKEIDESLKRLKTDYIDLILIHAPRPWPEMGPNATNRYFKENVEVYRALEEAYRQMKVRAIGVSNFYIDDLQNILDNCIIIPQVNQIQVNIEYTQFELIEFCKKHKILVEAYAPNATGRLLKNQKAKEIADKYGVSIPRLGIKYNLQLGLLPLPKSVHEEYIKENADMDFVISAEDMEILKEMAKVK